jgi:hypothetical protein
VVVAAGVVTAAVPGVVAVMVLDLRGRDGGVVRPASGRRGLRGGGAATAVLVGAVLDAVATVVLDLGAVFLVRGGGRPPPTAG